MSDIVLRGDTYPLYPSPGGSDPATVIDDPDRGIPPTRVGVARNDPPEGGMDDPERGHRGRRSDPGLVDKQSGEVTRLTVADALTRAEGMTLVRS